MKILVINPGSTSTKLAVYNKKNELWKNTIKHDITSLKKFPKIIDQLDWRQELIEKNIKNSGFKLKNFTALAARGGVALDPVSGGTYKIDREIVKDLYSGKNGQHASNLAGIIACNLAQKFNISAYTVDPITVDEFEPVARLSGIPEIQRKCQSHALNLKALARKTAYKIGEDLNDINLVGVHLGGGISVAAIRKGKIIDVNNANQNGPYSPDRCGTLPVLDLVKFIYHNNYKENQIKKKLVGKGGITAYLGTNDCIEIEKRIKDGDKKAELIYKGMIYQINKEIGAMSAILAGAISAIFISGGLAHSKFVINGIEKNIKWIAPVIVYPGSEEMRYLAEGVYRVLSGEVRIKNYREEIINSGDIT